MLPEGASPILKVDADAANAAVVARKPKGGAGGTRIFGALFAFSLHAFLKLGTALRAGKTA